MSRGVDKMKTQECLYEDEKFITKIKKEKNSYIMLILIIILSISFIFSFAVGRYGISPVMLLKIFFSKLFNLPVTWSSTVETIIINVRTPRIIAAMLVGAALSISGASYQGLFKNPMVSPDILGASAGAGFGAALGILLSFSVVEIQIMSFVFGLGAVMLTYSISTFIGRGNNGTLVLVLTGMVIATLFSSFTSMTKYVADPYSKLPAITFWLMGSLSSITASDVKVLMVPILIGAIPLILLRWKINVLSFGEEEAKAMGIDTFRLRMIIIFSSTMITAASVSISGMIGWVGLIIPHIARLIVGPNYKVLIPASILIGSTYLLLVDNLARSIFSIEIPLGILTSLIGAPFFIFLLLKGRRGWI